MMESQSDWCFEAWWNLSTEGMSLEDLQMFRTSLENMKLNLLAAVQEKQLITSSLSQTSHPHFPNMSTFAPDYVQHSSNTAATTSPAVGYASF
ncbi:hypothetical protein Fmac_021631 [Flemingia macrophylla]|uniref:Uncharacterized protein n=1 Tax=Flemingia macrophylla TaxID=520843 RepID=A0ABD1LXG4_9FABA